MHSPHIDSYFKQIVLHHCFTGGDLIAELYNAIVGAHVGITRAGKTVGAARVNNQTIWVILISFGHTPLIMSEKT